MILVFVGSTMLVCFEVVLIVGVCCRWFGRCAWVFDLETVVLVIYVAAWVLFLAY